MLHAEAILDGYKLRSTMDAAEFAKKHPEMTNLLIEAQIMAEEFFGE